MPAFWLAVAAVAGIASIFIWGLRGVHRFPIEAATYVAVVLALLLSNAAYIRYGINAGNAAPR